MGCVAAHHSALHRHSLHLHHLRLHHHHLPVGHHHLLPPLLLWYESKGHGNALSGEIAKNESSG